MCCATLAKAFGRRQNVPSPTPSRARWGTNPPAGTRRTWAYGRRRSRLKGTRVDGIYTADPEKDPTATKFHDITYDEVLKRGLKVMDLTATCMCKENNLPIIVFDMDTVGNLKKVMQGEEIGTLVHN